MHTPQADQPPSAIAPAASSSELRIDGARFTRTGISFDAPPSASQVHSVGHTLALMESCLDWGWADFLPQMVRTHPRANRKSPPEQLALVLVGEYATFNGQDARRLHERDKIGRLFPHHMRRASLTFEHYPEAYYSCGNNVDAALVWLERAETNKWTVAQMRAEIRRSRTDHQSTQTQTVESSELEISNLELASARRLRAVKSFDADRARAELEAIRNTVALVDALRARAVPGKESLSSD